MFMRAENSRACPRQDTVSVRYGVRKPKYLLIKNRLTIAKEFLIENPSCSFSLSVILREAPANVVHGSERDFDRNCCPIHSNFQKIHAELREQGLHLDIPVSCRAMCGKMLCKGEKVKVMEPLTWGEDCGLRTCSTCPKGKTEVPEEKKNTVVTVLQWATTECPRKQKKVHTLVPMTMSLEEAARRHDEQLNILTGHVYRAARQWQACKLDIQNLGEGEVLCIEDYQMNLEISFSECTTSGFFNKEQLAMHPSMVHYRDPASESIKKGGLIFISEDMAHDFHQVCCGQIFLQEGRWECYSKDIEQNCSGIF